MIFKYLRSISLALLFIPSYASALLEPNIVVLEDVATVEEGVSKISSTLESQGLDIVLTLDHSANAASVGLELAPTTVIYARFSNIVEQAILRKGQTVAIDLPIKFLVYENDNEIRLASNAIGYLIDRHTLKTNDILLNKIDRFQDQFAAPDNGLVTIKSARSVAETADAIQGTLIATGVFGIPLVINYGEKQKSNRYFYRKRNSDSILIVFGNPNVGTPLMQAQQTIGIDLPQKYLIWKDGLGGVNTVSYTHLTLPTIYSV